MTGKRKEVIDRNNSIVLVEPKEPLDVDADNKVIIFVENQGVYHWATVPEGQDPPVWGRLNEPGLQWTQVSDTLSEFLIGCTLYGFVMGAPYGGTASWVPQDVVDRIARVLPPLPIRPWAWPGDSSRFYGSRGAFMFVSPNGESDGVMGYSLWLGSKTAESVAFFKNIVDDAWEVVAL